jgi:hypothetical protein
MSLLIYCQIKPLECASMAAMIASLAELAVLPPLVADAVGVVDFGESTFALAWATFSR